MEMEELYDNDDVYKSPNHYQVSLHEELSFILLTLARITARLRLKAGIRFIVTVIVVTVVLTTILQKLISVLVHVSTRTAQSVGTMPQ